MLTVGGLHFPPQKLIGPIDGRFLDKLDPILASHLPGPVTNATGKWLDERSNGDSRGKRREMADNLGGFDGGRRW